MISRRNVFKDLVKGIFDKCNVRFIDDNTRIATDGNKVTRAKFDVADHQRFREIFIAAFNHMDIVKNIYVTPENEKVFFYSDLIENSEKYFISLGFDIDKKLLHSTSENVLGKMFCCAITQIILPFVFNGKDPDENAELDFKQVKSELMSYFNGFELGYIVHNHAKAKDVETVFDSEYEHDKDKKIKDCLYAVPIDRSIVEHDIMRCCRLADIKLKVKNKDCSKRYTIESIIGDYQKFPFSDDEPFIDPFAVQIGYSLANIPRYTIDSYFPLSSVVIPPQYFVPRFFYYITPINDNIIKGYEDAYEESYRDNKNGHIDHEKFDHESLNFFIVQRAVKDFRQEHYSDISEFYFHVMEYIEDIMRRITTADYTSSICKDSDDVGACQKFTKHFNIDYEKIINYIEEDDCVKKCYELIERALYSFISSFESDISKLTEDFYVFQCDNILSHYNSIGNYLKSDNLTKAIKLKEKMLSESSNGNEEFKLPKKDHYTDCDIWAEFDRYDYCRENIYKKINNILKKYYDTLGKAIENLK